MARDVGRAGRGNEPRGRVALVTVGFAVLVRVVDHDAQPRTESLEPTHDFRIGQVIGKDIGQHFGVGLAFVEEVEKNAARLKTEPRVRPPLAFERHRVEIELWLADRWNDLSLVGEVALIGLRTGEAAREPYIEERTARGAVHVDRRPRGGLGDDRIVAVPEHRRHLIGHRAIERNCWIGERMLARAASWICFAAFFAFRRTRLNIRKLKTSRGCVESPRKYWIPKPTKSGFFSESSISKASSTMSSPRYSFSVRPSVVLPAI